MTKKRLFSLLGSLATLLVTLVVIAGLFELSVRLFVDNGMNFNLEMWKYARDVKQRSADPLIGHEHRPFAEAHLMGVDVKTNSIGHRDFEYPVARQPGVPRIMMLGDSFVEGWGVPFDETITKRLERMFTDSGRKVEVMNTGVGNYGSVQEVEAFMVRDAKFKPDIVVLNFDFRSAIPVPKYEYDNWLGRHSEGVVFLMAGLDSMFRMAGAGNEWDKSYLRLFDQPGWQDAKAAIERLADYCRKNNIKLVIANWPELHDVNNYRLGHITDLIRGVAEQEHVPFVDLLNAVKGQEPSKLWVTAPDPHPNGYANELYAKYLFPILEGMLPTPSNS